MDKTMIIQIQENPIYEGSSSRKHSLPPEDLFVPVEKDLQY